MKQSRESYMEKAVTTRHRYKPVTEYRVHRRSLASLSSKRQQPTVVAPDDELGLSLDDLDKCLDAARLDGGSRVQPGSKGAEDGDV